MNLRVHRTRPLLAVPAVAVAIAVAALAATAAPAAADVTIPFHYRIDASTRLKKLNQTVVVPPGTFDGSIDLTTATLTGSIALPPASTNLRVAGIPAATATFQMVQEQPVSGTVDFSTMAVTATAVFDIRIVSVRPTALPFVNLVGNSCTTSKPVSVTMTGAVSADATFSGTYSIPPLETCGALTPALNLVVPGGGNTFTAHASPA